MTPLLQRNITDMSKSKTMIDQNAFDYTLRWWPDQNPNSCRCGTAVQRSAICGLAKARCWYCCTVSVPSWTCFNG